MKQEATATITLKRGVKMDKAFSFAAFAISAMALISLSGIAGASQVIASCQHTALTNFYVTGVAWAGNSSRNFTSQPIAVGPGSNDVPIQVKLYNPNDCELVGVLAKVPLTSQFTTINGSSTAYDYIGNVQPYSFFSAIFYLDIPNTTQVSPTEGYYEPLDLYWNYTNDSNSYYYSTTFYAPVRGTTGFSINATSHGLLAGSVNNITIKLRNTGSGYAYDVKPSIASSSSLNPVGEPSEAVSLAPNATAYLTIPVYVSPGAAGQSISAQLNLAYSNAYGNNESLQTTLDLFGVAPASQVSLTSQYDDVEAGVPQNTSIIVSNSGSSPITNVTVQLTPQSPMTIIGSDGYFSFPYIAAHSNASMPMDLYVTSSSSTVATLSAQISYVLDGQAESGTRDLSFLTPGAINITETSTALLPAAPSAGGIFSVTGTLINSGTTSASALSISTSGANGISVLGANSTFIGTVGVDSPTSFTVSFEASRTVKPGTYTIPLDIEYLNNLNQKQSKLIYVPVQISPSSANSTFVTGNSTFVKGTFKRKSSDFGLLAIAAIIIVAIVVAAAYIKIFRKRSDKKSKKHVKE